MPRSSEEVSSDGMASVIRASKALPGAGFRLARAEGTASYLEINASNGRALDFRKGGGTIRGMNFRLPLSATKFGSAFLLTGILLVPSMLASCAKNQASETVNKSRQDWSAAAVDYRGEMKKFLSPKEQPPQLQSLSFGARGDIASVKFYSTNEPMVILCTDTNAACEKALSPAVIFRRGKSDTQAFTIALLYSEDPTKEPQLSDSLAEYWRKAEMVGATPQWLQASPK